MGRVWITLRPAIGDCLAGLYCGFPPHQGQLKSTHRQVPEILEKTSAPLDDLNETKALVLGQRTGLLDAIAVADTGGLVLIVILHARIGAHDFAVQRVAVKVVPASDIDTWEEAQSHEFGIAEGAASWVGARQPVAVVAHAIFTERLARAIPKYPHLGDVLSEDVHDPISVPHYSWGCVSIVGNCPPCYE